MRCVFKTTEVFAVFAKLWASPSGCRDVAGQCFYDFYGIFQKDTTSQKQEWKEVMWYLVPMFHHQVWTAVSFLKPMVICFGGSRGHGFACFVVWRNDAKDPKQYLYLWESDERRPGGYESKKKQKLGTAVVHRCVWGVWLDESKFRRSEFSTSLTKKQYKMRPSQSGIWQFGWFPCRNEFCCPVKQVILETTFSMAAKTEQGSPWGIHLSRFVPNSIQILCGFRGDNNPPILKSSWKSLLFNTILRPFSKLHGSVLINEHDSSFWYLSSVRKPTLFPHLKMKKPFGQRHTPSHLGPFGWQTSRVLATMPCRHGGRRNGPTAWRILAIWEQT